MICHFPVTFITGIISITAFEFYSNDIKRRMPMPATGLLIG
jgi:hypothetical protein